MRFKVRMKGASILDDDTVVIERIIDEERVGTVLEFGPGASTAVFLNKGLLVHSCEHDDKWMSLYSSEFSGAATFFRYENVHDVRIDGLLDHYDLCFVDSPVGTPSLSRINTLVFGSRKSGLILLHDSKRHGERQSVELMVNMGFEASFFDTKKGLALLRKS